MAPAKKSYKKKPVKRTVKSKNTAMSEVITVRVSDEEKERMKKIMADLDITRYSDVMRMALQMMKPHVRYSQGNIP